MAEKENGIIRHYNDKEQLKYEYFNFNTKKEGEFKRYYDDKQLYRICNYKNNKLEGEDKEYYENGQIWGIHNYKDGKIKENIYSALFKPGLDNTLFDSVRAIL